MQTGASQLGLWKGRKGRWQYWRSFEKPG